MRAFSANLSLPFSTDLQVFTERPCDLGKLGHFHVPATGFDERVSVLLLQHGIIPSHFEVFYTPPHRVLPIHIDGNELSNIVKLNWVFGGAKSRMMWWRIKSNHELSKGSTPLGTTYLKATPTDCIMLESASIGQPTLVNVGQLHSVLNHAEPRWCLSLVLADAETKINLTFEQAKQRLSDYLC